jgi:hypothetical protein
MIKNKSSNQNRTFQYNFFVLLFHPFKVILYKDLFLPVFSFFYNWYKYLERKTKGIYTRMMQLLQYLI